jgi:hypothetical protein
VLSRDSPDLAAALAQVGGLDLADTTMRPQGHIDLPAVLAQVDGTDACRGFSRPTMAVTIGVMMRRAGARARDDRTLAERLGLPQGTRVGLLLFAHDADLEDLWARGGLWIPTIARWAPAFVTTADFSVWEGDHALATRYNVVRSVRHVSILQDAGLPVVPHVFWADDRDLHDWARWIDDNRPEAIAMDLQCAGRGHIHRLIPELLALRQAVARPPRLLVNGIDIGALLGKVVGAWPEATITRNYVPEVAKHVEARERRDGSVARRSSDEPPNALLDRRIRLVEDWADRHDLRPGGQCA